MNLQLRSREKLILKIRDEITYLTENEILSLLEAIHRLKKLRDHPNRDIKSIMVQAKSRAVETRHLSHEELMGEFSEALKAIHENSNRISSAS